jgi:hypothetical protein
LALAEARTLFSDENDFLLVSLGCGGAARAGFPADLQQKRRHIFEWSLTAQSACADYQMGAFLPAQRYIRIQEDSGRGKTCSMHVYTRDKAALRQSVMYPGERKSVWELVQALRSSKPQSRNRMMPDLWATRQAEIVRGMEMER